MRKRRALIFLFSMIAIVMTIGQLSANRESLRPIGTATHGLHLVLKAEMIHGSLPAAAVFLQDESLAEHS